MHPTTQYALDVVSGKLTTCKWEKLACQRHLDNLHESNSNPDYPYVFDETRADRIINYFLYCRHVRGAFSGQPIALDDWQKFDLGCIFGWVKRDSGRRRFKTAYIRVARGNAKAPKCPAWPSMA